MRNHKYWNSRVGGLAGAFIFSWKSVYNKVSSKIITLIHRHNFSSCGENVCLNKGLFYTYPHCITLGNDIIIGKNVNLTNAEIPSGHLIIEDGVSIDQGCHIDFSGNITLKKNAHISTGVYISTHDHGYDYMANPIGKSLEIGEFAFVGAKSVILHNCNYIGAHSVIGTGSVVTKDVPDYAIVAGNPARVIKFINQ